MSKHLTRDDLSQKADLRVKAPVATALGEPAVDTESQITPVEVDRSFEMPKALYGITVGLYLGFVMIMALGLRSPTLVIPMVIFAFFIIAGFSLPAIWTRLAPNAGQKPPLSLGRLFQHGIMTHTGLLSGRDATVQMLILPVLIVGWGVVTVAIAAIVTAG